MTTATHIDPLQEAITDIDYLAELIGVDEEFDETDDIAELDALLVPVSFAD